MVKLQCLEANEGCLFETQNLPFDNADKMLEMHLPRCQVRNSQRSVQSNQSEAQEENISQVRNQRQVQVPQFHAGNNQGRNSSPMRNQSPGPQRGNNSQMRNQSPGPQSYSQNMSMRNQSPGPQGGNHFQIRNQSPCPQSSLQSIHVQAPGLYNPPMRNQSPGPSCVPAGGAGARGGPGPGYVKLTGMVWTATEEDVRNLLFDCDVTQVLFLMNEYGKPTGDGLVELSDKSFVEVAKRHNRKFIGTRFVVIQESNEREFYTSLSSSGNALIGGGGGRGGAGAVGGAGAAANVGPGHGYVKLSGMVWTATEDDVRRLLYDCNIVSVQFLMNEYGKPLGDGIVELASKIDAFVATKHNREYIGARFVVVQQIDEREFKQLSMS